MGTKIAGGELHLDRAQLLFGEAVNESRRHVPEEVLLE
jgi:hypothetical protein